jgi:hypothetical protein
MLQVLDRVSADFPYLFVLLSHHVKHSHGFEMLQVLSPAQTKCPACTKRLHQNCSTATVTHMGDVAGAEPGVLKTCLYHSLLFQQLCHPIQHSHGFEMLQVLSRVSHSVPA